MHLCRAILFVKDLPRMAAFYGDVLGLEVVEDSRGDTWLELEIGGGARLALHAIPPQIAARIEIASPPEPREDNPIKLAFAVNEVASERARLEALGATVIERPWGSCDIVDPEGNILQITSAGT